MKRNKVILVVFAIAFAFLAVIPPAMADSANQAPLAVSVKHIVNSDQFLDINFEYPVVSGMRDHEFQVAFNKYVEADMLQLKNSLLSQAKAAYRDAAISGFPYRRFDLTSKVIVDRNDGAVLSFSTRIYTYTGGAHGDNDARFYTLLNLARGKQLTILQLFSNPNAGASRIAQVINDKISADSGDYTPGITVKIGSSTWYYLTESELHVIFRINSIAPHVAGEPEFILPLSDFKDILIHEISMH